MSLILSRKVNEKIQLGNDVTITITKIKGGRVHVAIEAPKEVKIRRGELKEAA
jgi:carbon storage regulator